jgi:NAD(P)-dependent dehydrogenase (short-subunit alcohol dehydrogenase family)
MTQADYSGKKSILITGCSSGIGYDAAHTLHKRGWRVFATCRAEEDCARLRGEGLESFPLDYESPDSVSAAVAETLERTGGTLDALFNNGAYAIPGAVEDLPREALRTIFEANLFGWHDLTCQLIPAMRAQGHGRIVNCSSVLGLVALKWRGAYNSTKFALEGLTDTLRLEMADTNIRVSLIEPGPITTDFRKNASKQFKKWINWQDSARADQYRDHLLKRLNEDSGGKDRFELPPSAVTDKLIHAIEAPRPRAHYYVTTPTYIAAAFRRALPTRVIDKIMARN